MSVLEHINWVLVASSHAHQGGNRFSLGVVKRIKLNKRIKSDHVWYRANKTLAVHRCKPSTWEMDLGQACVQGQPGLQCDTVGFFLALKMVKGTHCQA